MTSVKPFMMMAAVNFDKLYKQFTMIQEKRDNEKKDNNENASLKPEPAVSMKLICMPVFFSCGAVFSSPL